MAPQDGTVPASDVADEVRQVRVPKELADCLRLADVEPVVSDHAQQHRPNRLRGGGRAIAGERCKSVTVRAPGTGRRPP